MKTSIFHTVLLFLIGVCNIRVFAVEDRLSCSRTGCKNAECMRLPGTVVRQCVCYPGFMKRKPGDKICYDINECRLGDWRICGFGKCYNRPGGYQCICNADGIPTYGGTYCRYNPYYADNRPWNPFQWLLFREAAEDLL